MFIDDLFQEGEIAQALCLNGEFITIPKGNGKLMICRNVQDLRKLFKTDKEVFEFIKNNNVDICFYLK